MKYINFKRLKFFTTIKGIISKRYNFSNIYKYLNYRRYKFSSYLKIFNIRKYKFSKVYNLINYKKIRIFLLYISTLLVASIIVYLSIPVFFSYEKIYISKKLCDDLKIECVIKGDINYSFIPTTKLKVKNLEIFDLFENKKTLATLKKVEIKIPLKNLLNINKSDFMSIELQDGLINLDYNKLLRYKKHFSNINSSKNIKIKNSDVEFFDGKKYITTLEKINFQYNNRKKIDKFILKGKFLGDNLYINFKNKKGSPRDLIIKLEKLNFLTKINFQNSNTKKSTVNGKLLVKKGKNRIAGLYYFKDNIITIPKANIKNSFLDGQISGDIKFNPFFDFDLNMDLNSLNFNTLHKNIVQMNDESKSNLFKINNKINGKLNLYSAKVFSKNTLINSFESNIKFINGNILIDKLLFSLGKLGAADLTGSIKNDKKNSNLKFESNIFIDNSKRFYGKFGIYNKRPDSSNFYASGNLDLVKLNLRLYEIINNGSEKIGSDDLTYIERELNNIILDEGYESLFNFSKIKEFIKLIVLEDN